MHHIRWEMLTVAEEAVYYGMKYSKLPLKYPINLSYPEPP